MISIVLYGRNDSYGYNLHKRAALSFNCMAELLSDANDEILFVDYNTPDDFPTFPEAIQDTLTARARKHLRILRVRPSVHRRFEAKTRLVALEPVSRNVAVRRSNPANRFILSTNTDMIFVPRGKLSSLSEMVGELPKGFYHAPRLEIPETLWEGLDRKNPQLAIETISEWGRTLHLNEIVLGAKTILYDGPGDFQLIERADLFTYHGFDEEMILGWHVDSNIAKRLYLVYGKVGDLGGQVFGYHCDHTRQITPAHSHTRTENDWRRFVDDLTDPDVPAQAASWGCAEEEIEEIRLSENASAVYVSALRDAIGAPLEEVPVARYTGDSYGTTDYDPRHVLPFLADIFVTAPRTTVVAWSGVRSETLELFARVWRSLGFTENILVDEALVQREGFAVAPGVSLVPRQSLLERANAFVFDLGSSKHNDAPIKSVSLSDSERDAILRSLISAVVTERQRWRDGLPPRRVICLNAIHTPYEMLVRGHIAAGLTPFATRMRHGFVLPPRPGKDDWTPQLQVGEAATTDGGSIKARPGVTGVVCYGPYRALLPGHFRIELQITGKADPDVDPLAPIGVLDLMWGIHNLGFAPIWPKDLEAGGVALEIDVTADGPMDLGGVVETVVRTHVPTSLVIESVTCEEMVGATPEPAQPKKSLDWIGLLTLGPGGRWTRDRHILAKSGGRGFVAYGPYRILYRGRYEACVEFEGSGQSDHPFLIVEVYSDARYRAVAYVNARKGRTDRCLLQFEVHPNESPVGELPIEIRLRTAEAGGVVKSVRVYRIGDAMQSSPWVPFPDPPADWPALESGRALAARALSRALSVKVGDRTVRSVLRDVKRRLINN